MVSVATKVAKADAASAEDERLLKLFRNRAELKQEFAKLRREGEYLKEQLQKQEGKHLRLQQRLDQLEGMLADPVQAANASVFYQLRGIWFDCAKRLQRLARELAENQVQREQMRSKESFEDKRDAMVAEMAKQVARSKQNLQETEAELQEAMAAMDMRFGFLRFRRRRGLRARIDALLAKRDVAETQYTRHKHKCDQKAAEQAPQIDDLSIEGKRKINLALVAIAQEFFLHFNKSNVAEQAREASVRNVTDVSYGDLKKCRELNDFIDSRVSSLPAGEELLAKVKFRARYLQTHASYHHTKDAIPVASSFAIIPAEVTDDGKPAEGKSLATNILSEEYWEIYSVLLN